MVAIETYTVTHFSHHPYAAQINCFDVNKKHVGTVTFYADDVALPPNAAASPPIINFAVSRLAEVIGTLRYEKPVEFSFNPANLIGSVGTSGLEAVGEQEG
ncbi:hypothetical protein LZG04_27075 [Saccharothrix sp. S26]|uniref:hypothetical protein n=1 Tax=Saccharothrix sp. S26 TaxID=2907215 RepID=UPI001F368B3F|nr:hypothetical protein [Saccharothrix sp. S26]MCE6998435.1 hypothetical protein [Saccharothrix sp. S26]